MCRPPATRELQRRRPTKETAPTRAKKTQTSQQKSVDVKTKTNNMSTTQSTSNESSEEAVPKKKPPPAKNKKAAAPAVDSFKEPPRKGKTAARPIGAAHVEREDPQYQTLRLDDWDSKRDEDFDRFLDQVQKSQAKTKSSSMSSNAPISGFGVEETQIGTPASS